MNPPLLAAALAALAAAPLRAQQDAAPPLNRAKTYGVLILAYDVDVKWRQELANLRGLLKGHPVESVDTAADAISVQRGLDKLLAQRVDKVVGVPLETVSDSTRLDMTRYMFGVRAEPALDVPGSSTGDAADKRMKPIKPVAKSALVLPAGQERIDGMTMGGGDVSTVKPLRSPVPLELAPAFDKSPLLVAILADRAKALTPTPGRETLVLAGIGPRNDEALKAWRIDASAIASAVGAKAGFRKAVAVSVRDFVRSDQRDKDRADLQATFRGLAREGRICVVPLSPEAGHVADLLKQAFGGFFAYRWNGAGIQGDPRLLLWIKTAAAEAASRPDGRQFNKTAPRAALGGMP
ncbi:MAG: hypothetical protein ACHQ49_17045 [Elusimicrobiota bacterium]